MKTLGYVSTKSVHLDWEKNIRAKILYELNVRKIHNMFTCSEREIMTGMEEEVI
jgi:hypothetical protein